MLSDLLPNLGDLIGNIIDYSTPFIQAYWPFLGVIMGIVIAFIVLTGIKDSISNAFYDWLDRNERKKELREEMEEIQREYPDVYKDLINK